jgi:hypothetical protein
MVWSFLGGFLPFAARWVEAAFLVLGDDDEASAVPGCIVQRLVGCLNIHPKNHNTCPGMLGRGFLCCSWRWATSFGGSVGER